MMSMTEATSTVPRWLTATEQSAWRGYLDMHAKLNARLNREMQEQSGISITDFSVLVQLSEHPDARMRVLELARALRWEKSRLSHQLTRMEQRQLVARSNCSEDRRGAFVVLTDHGRDVVEAAAPQHVESVRRYVFDEITPDQVAALDEIARTVGARLDAGDGGCGSVDACDGQ
jgi:DNA-binding MarR family transcriptional regulator